MSNFWKDLKKPILVQAPMEDVTDTVFRQIIAKCGAPDVFFTEFTNVEGMCSRGKAKVGKRLIFTPIERPIVAQLWGLDPAKFLETAKMVKEMGFDGIDINMGCPEKGLVKKGLCGGMIGNQTLAKEIILAVQEGAGDRSLAEGGLPVSVKTRIGIKDIQTEKWIGFLLGLNLDALTVHGRTVAEMSDVSNHWDEIGKAVELRDSMKLKTLIIGNGDIKSKAEALEKAEKYKLDGVMIGRGIFGNLWIFNDKNINPDEVPYQEKLKLLIEHVELFDKTWGKNPGSSKTAKNFSLMKKFYRIYISGIPNACAVRTELMRLMTAEETLKLLKQLI